MPDGANHSPQTVILTTKNTASLTLGIVSVALGSITLLFGWIPFVGLIAIPIAALGAMVALIGGIVAIGKGFKGFGMPATGGLICIFAITVSMTSTKTVVDVINDSNDHLDYSQNAGATLSNNRSANGNYNPPTNGQLESNSNDQLDSSQNAGATLSNNRSANGNSNPPTNGQLETNSNDIESNNNKILYMKDKIRIYDLELRYMTSVLNGKVPGLTLKIKNESNQTISYLKLNLFFKDRNGNVIHEEAYTPINTKSLFDPDKPLKPGYIWQNEKGTFSAFKSVPDEWVEGSFDFEIADLESAIGNSNPPTNGQLETNSNDIESNNNKKLYMKDKIRIYDLELRYMKSVLNGKVPGLTLKIKNEGNQTISYLKLNLFFKDRNGNVIHEEAYTPINTKSLFDPDKPLKPGYIWQNEKGTFSAFKSVPGEWVEGSFAFEIADLEFDS